MCGNFVEVTRKPQYKSVEQYRRHLRDKAPNSILMRSLFEPDIECTCCTQEAPAEAAAMIKVEDQTPFTKKFGLTEVSPTGKHGEIVWICADCFTNGVRPKHVYFGDIKWNKMGRTVQQKADDSRGHPW